MCNIESGGLPEAIVYFPQLLRMEFKRSWKDFFKSDSW